MMKRIMIQILKKSYLFLLPICFSCGDTAKGQAPKAVEQTFKEMYPNENDPDWHKDKNGYYEANFKIDGERYRADYMENGTWIETENDIKFKTLPKSVREVIEKEYDKDDIIEIERVKHYKKGTFFDVEFKIDGKKKDIEFNKDGKIINVGR